MGMTRQLIGEDWLHAAPFRYCGSIGPLLPSPYLQKTLEKIGNVLTQATGLAGVFGIDFVLREEVPWLVEINPRYTASVEVLELGLGLPILSSHANVFREGPLDSAPAQFGRTRLIAKNILFARQPVVFPAQGPWAREDGLPTSLMEPPSFADIPTPGEQIESGKPVLTFFVQGSSISNCLQESREKARYLDQLLFES
jgi:predicted ATP-grasp superfamily ATP-dependent carboligase